MRVVCRLVPQQIPPRAGSVKQTVALFGSFADGKRDGTVGIFGADAVDQHCQFVVREIRVFSALQHERAVAERIPFVAAGQDLVRLETVARNRFVAAADAAVQAVVSAYVGEFDQTPQVYVRAVPLAANRVGSGKQRSIKHVRPQQRRKRVVGQIAFVL